MTDDITFDTTVTIPLRVTVSIDRSNYLRASCGSRWDSESDISSSIYADVLNEVMQVTPALPATLEDTLSIADDIEVNDCFSPTLKVEGETRDDINDIAKELFDRQERELACGIDLD